MFSGFDEIEIDYSLHGSLYFALSTFFNLKGCVGILVDSNSIFKFKQYC